MSEADVISLTGSNVTTSEKLASALETETGQNFSGGTYPGQIPQENISIAVDGISNQGSKPFMALLYEEGATMQEGHWVIVEGTTANGAISILDPAGVSYTMDSTDFFKALKYQNLVFHKP